MSRAYQYQQPQGSNAGPLRERNANTTTSSAHSSKDDIRLPGSRRNSNAGLMAPMPDCGALQQQQPQCMNNNNKREYNYIQPPTVMAPSAKLTALEKNQPCFVGEYVSEILDHLLTAETDRYPRDPSYMSTVQTEISERMRTILVDWMVDVAIKFKLHHETFYLAVEIVDRFLAKEPAQRQILQLIGITAILIAAKHDEIWPPEVKECVYISANTYTRDEVLKMERKIAETLKFRFTLPTPYPFVSRFMTVLTEGEEPMISSQDNAERGSEMQFLTSMFLETAALDYNLLRFSPSRVAAGACLAAAATMHRIPRVPQMVTTSAALADPSLQKLFDIFAATCCQPNAANPTTASQFWSDAVEVAKLVCGNVHTLHTPSSRYQAVRRKYSNEKHRQVLERFAIPKADDFF